MLGLAVNEASALPLYAVRPVALAAFLSTLSAAQVAVLQAHGFDGSARQLGLLTGEAGLAGAVLGLGVEQGPYVFGDLASALPAGSVWRLVAGDYDAEQAALGFLLGAYAYEHFKPRKRGSALLSPLGVSPRCIAMAEAVCFARDLINTPPNLLGPEELAAAAVQMAAAFGARAEIITGSELHNRYPALAAVAAGSERPGQVARFEWEGSKATAASPLISLCGKGVCFDTGGYDVKPSAAMLRMKKDMGGAAILLGLAKLIMACDLPIRLQVRIGCVENSISGRAMRPSDVLQTHAGKTVEVGNTDAEGRLVLCDLLAEAAAETPDWLIDAATLTGAARVALGPDLPAMFCNNDKMANSLLTGGEITHDPLWRLPLWHGYDSWLDSNIADMNNVSAKPFAGAIVAALFLQRFVPKEIAWAHIDVYCWNDQARPGRPEGGEAQSLRALFSAIENFNSL
ncbi:MAG: leucyl aminopeptidase family protein [Acidocella sp.]|nr:leucyl aminopeptidase family protein [Acidocella sp.]